MLFYSLLLDDKDKKKFITKNNFLYFFYAFELFQTTS